MNIKAIVMDMDGTLLNSKNKISQKTKDALIECQKNGIKNFMRIVFVKIY